MAATLGLASALTGQRRPRDFPGRLLIAAAVAMATASAAVVAADFEARDGPAFSDTGISGFLSGHDRREVHAKAET